MRPPLNSFLDSDDLRDLIAPAEWVYIDLPSIPTQNLWNQHRIQ